MSKLLIPLIIVILLAGIGYLYIDSFKTSAPTTSNEPLTTNTPEPTKTPDIVDKDSGIKGTVLLGPTCPVERIPPDPQCADKLYKTDLVLTASGQTQVIKEFKSDSNGKFTLNIQPGKYVISPATSTNLLPRCANSGIITVREGAYTEITISCDTGIR
jgi:hypothetical protein